jgi:excisionase family DNA binding protein
MLSGSLIAPPEQKEPLQVTVLEAARLLSYDTRTIRQLIAQGELAVVGKGRLCRVVMQSIYDFQQRHRCEHSRSGPSARPADDTTPTKG